MEQRSDLEESEFIKDEYNVHQALKHMVGAIRVLYNKSLEDAKDSREGTKLSCKGKETRGFEKRSSIQESSRFPEAKRCAAHFEE